jgi:hypothetical protein
VWA